MGWVMLMGEEQRRLTEHLDPFFFSLVLLNMTPLPGKQDSNDLKNML